MTKMQNSGLIRIREELDLLLDGVPPVKAGYRRVFRGQTALYDEVVASLLRPGRPQYSRRHRLKAVSQFLLEEFRGSAGDGNDFALWTELIAQQYSTGSPYLDVTSRVDVALWFALNQFESTEYVPAFGEPGPFDPTKDISGRVPLLIPRRSARDSGYLFVLDVPTTADGLPHAHADFADLTALPVGLQPSTRIQHQSASLVYTNRKTNGGDLSPYLACPPIPLAPELIASIDSEITSEFLFPTPDHDEWYRRLLQLPLWPRLTQTNELELQQSFEVPLYAWDDPSMMTVSEPLIILQPTLLTPTLKTEPLIGPVDPAPLLAPDAISILVEEPIFLTSPSFDDPVWNHAALWAGIPHLAQVRPQTGGEHTSVDLTKVYFEFSPLELGDWQTAEASGSTFHAGAYLTRQGNVLTLWRVQRNLPSGLSASGPFKFRYADESKRFMYDAPNGRTHEATEAGVVFKTLLICLRLLLCLNLDAVPDGLQRIADGLDVRPLVGRMHLLQSEFENAMVYLPRRDDESGHSLPKILGFAVSSEA